jgi:hypothetical protein
MLEYGQFPDTDLLDEFAKINISSQFIKPGFIEQLMNVQDKDTQEYKDAIAYVRKNVVKVNRASEKVLEKLRDASEEEAQSK